MSVILFTTLYDRFTAAMKNRMEVRRVQHFALYLRYSWLFYNKSVGRLKYNKSYIWNIVFRYVDNQFPQINSIEFSQVAHLSGVDPYQQCQGGGGACLKLNMLWSMPVCSNCHSLGNLQTGNWGGARIVRWVGWGSTTMKDEHWLCTVFYFETTSLSSESQVN